MEGGKMNLDERPLEGYRRKHFYFVLLHTDRVKVREILESKNSEKKSFLYKTLVSSSFFLLMKVNFTVNLYSLFFFVLIAHLELFVK